MKLIDRIAHFSVDRANLIIIVTIAISMAAVFSLPHLQFSGHYQDLIPDDQKAIRLIEKNGLQEPDFHYLILAVQNDRPFEIQRLQALEKAIGNIEDEAEIHDSVNPFNLPTFERTGSRLRMVTMSPGAAAPDNAVALETFQRRLQNDVFARNLIVSPDFTTFSVLFPTDRMEDYSDLLVRIRNNLKPVEEHFSVHLGGQIVFDDAARKALVGDAPIYLVSGLAVVFIVFFLGFRTIRGVLLPINIVIVGTLWTLTFMSLVGFRLSIMSVVTPALILTLGSSYCIHVLNRYYREAPTSPSEIAAALARVLRTILIASATTAIGFTSLLVTSIQQVREFGVATAVGIVFCALLSAFYLPAVLSKLPPPNKRQQFRIRSDVFTRLSSSLSKFVIRHRWVILGALVLIGGSTIFSFRALTFRTDYTGLFRKEVKAVEDNLFIARQFGTFVHAYLTIDAGQKDYFLDVENLHRISDLEDTLAEKPDVAHLSSFVSYLKAMNKAYSGDYAVPPNPAMISLLRRSLRLFTEGSEGAASHLGKFVDKDFSRMTIVMRVYDSDNRTFIFEDRYKELVESIEQDMKAQLPANVDSYLWGMSLSSLRLSDTLRKDQLRSIALSAVLVFAVIAFTLRSVRLGLISLAPMAAGILMNFALMALFRIPLDAVTLTFSGIVIGLGVDDSVHLLLHYKRNRKSMSIPGTIETTLHATGRPIILTSIALIAGLSVLSLSTFTPVVYFGVLVASAVSTTTTGALILVPALLAFEKGERNHRREVRKLRLQSGS